MTDGKTHPLGNFDPFGIRFNDEDEDTLPAVLGNVLSSAVDIATRSAPVGKVMGVVYELGGGYLTQTTNGDYTYEDNGDLLGGVVGGVIAGAAVGSVFPGLGTMAGGFVGAVAGYVGGTIGSSIGKAILYLTYPLQNRVGRETLGT